MAKKILFISTMNLSMNPRILKEIRLAGSLGYEVHFLGFSLGNWSDELDSRIREGIPFLHYTYLDASRKKYLRWLKHSLLERFYRSIWTWNQKNLSLTATASSKRVFALLDFGKRVQAGDYDLIIAHTLGALYPASRIAEKGGSPFAFDLEDYHPGEHIEDKVADEVKRREMVMKKILPAAKYISASSPLIGRYTAALCGLDEHKIIPVLNLFPSTEFKTPVTGEGRIRLIWFSQFIGPGRGLEILLSVWNSIKGSFDLTLIGGTPEHLEGVVQEGITIKPPVSQTELHALLSGYDVGLALDLASRDINRDIALTNKILAYYQSGMYILATDTAAQKNFLEQHPGTGQLFVQNDIDSLVQALKNIRDQITVIRSGATKRYREAQTNNWEQQSHKLKETWEQVLH